MSNTIAVVGAGPGIGFAVAERFGAEGFRVALIARRKKALDELAGKLREKGIDAAGFSADVLDRSALTKSLGEAIGHFGAIDVLEYGPAPTRDSLRTPKAMDVENEQFHLDLAVLGAITAVRVVLPGLLERKSGALLFTTAVSAQYPVPHTASFGVAAGAALNYARLLYQDLKPDGIYAGIVSIAGIVVQRGKETGRSPNGLPLVAAQDVADAHWRLYTERNTPEAIVGDANVFKALSGRGRE